MRLEFESNVSTVPFTSDQGADNEKFAEILADGIKAAQAGDRVKAKTLLLNATEIDQRSENAWLWLASISEYPEELIVFLNKVLEINPVNERALEWISSTKSLLSKTLVQRGIDASKECNMDMAVKCFNQALEYDERNQMAWLWIASLSDSEVRKMEYLERVLTINPHNEAAQTALESTRVQKLESLKKEAKQAAVSGNAELANELVDQILAESPDSEDAWTIRSLMAVNLADKMQAFEKLIEINPENSAARANLESLTAFIETVEPKAEEPSAQQELFAEEFSSEGSIEQNEIQETIPEENFGSEMVESDPELEQVNSETQVPKITDFDDDEPGLTAVEFDSDDEQTDEAAFTPAPIENSPFESRVDEETEEEEIVFVADDEDSGSISAAPEAEAEDAPSEILADTNEESVAEEEISPFEAETVQFSTDEAFAANGEAVNHYVDIGEFFSKSAENGIPKPNDEFVQPEPPNPYATRLVVAEKAEAVEQPVLLISLCPYCNAENEAQTFVCKTCKAVLSLSDLEMLLASQPVMQNEIKTAVEKMTSEKRRRDFSEIELVNLAVGHLNLKNYNDGFACLQQASQLSPNDVVLSGQVNALAIRLEEIRRKDESIDNSAKSKMILVVDDSPTVRKLIAGKLEKAGHEVVSASDGVEATAIIANVVPDLVLLDITMPNMDGYQVCKIIRNNESTKDVPVVMISGKDGFFDKVRGRMAGTTGFITKPFGPETLMRTLELYLKKD